MRYSSPWALSLPRRSEAGRSGVAAEHVEADVDLVDARARPALASLILDDARHGACLVAHDAAVVRGVGEPGRRERRGGVGVVSRWKRPATKAASHQRHVAVQHHDVAVEPVQRIEAGAHRVARAASFLLDGALAARRAGCLATSS